jgi:hypothetical protein
MPTTLPDPVSERLSASVLAALQNVTVANGYTCTLVNPHRATASVEEGSPANLSTVVWQHEVKPDKVGSAPFGQAEWVHIFEVAVALRLSNTDTTPIGRRINLTRADVERALMADPRRGGLCFVDNEILDPVLTEDSEAKIFGVRVMLMCQYRTLRGDPRQLAPIAGNETYFQGGATLYIAPRVNQYLVGPWTPYADVRVVPRLAPETETINSDADGMSRPTVERYAAHAIRYEVDVGYLNPDLIVRQVGGGAVATATQTGGTYTAVPHRVAGVNCVIPLMDAAAPAGQSVFGVTAVAAVTSADGATTYAAGTDYAALPTQLPDGMLAIPAGSTIPPGATVLITFAAPAQNRVAVTVGTACNADVRARIVWTASDGTQLVHGDFDASLVATSAAAPPGELTSTKLILNVLGDGSAVPMGRYLLPAGPTPAGY